MLNKTVLTADDLTGLVAAIYEYNGRGPVIGVLFFDQQGQPLPVAWAEAWSEDRGLSVRTKPEPTAEELAARISRLPVQDPRAIPGPASFAELDAAMRE
jgi:hypothetical protein